MLPNNNPVEPLVVRILRDHRLGIMAQEDAVMRSLAAAWVEVENNLRAEMQMLAFEASGKPLSGAKLVRMERHQRLLAQAEARSQLFMDAAANQIGDFQGQLARRGIDHAVEAIRAVYADSGKISAYFDVLSYEAVENLIGLTTEGAPLRKYLEDTFPRAVNGMTRALIDGVAQGLEPVVIANNMVAGYGMGFNTAINMARTEPLRAYRAASQQQYAHSGVVSGWKRLAAHDGRVCAGCLFTEGEFYKNKDEFSEHNQGRCTAVPVVMDANEPQWVGGAAWFMQQDDETQQSILGTGRFNAWKDGASLDKMVKRVSDPVWGGAFIPAPVQEITQ